MTIEVSDASAQPFPMRSSGASSTVAVYPLGCGPDRAVADFELESASMSWAVELEPGAYELGVFAYFETEDGRSGDTYGVLGLLVDPEPEPGDRAGRQEPRGLPVPRAALTGARTSRTIRRRMSAHLEGGRDQYFLGHASAEQQRLRQQAEELAEESAWLFDRIGIRPGARVVEVGCGPQGCLELLSERVGVEGSVVGIEISDEAVGLARAFLDERRITNAQVLHGDAKSAALPHESFDLATARLVLVNIPEPEALIAEMVALVRPGGTVALHEADWRAHVCDPPLPEWDRLMAALEAYATRNGIDLFVGRRLPRMLAAAGLSDVRVNPLIHAYGPGHSRRPIFLQFVNNLRERIVAEGLISEAEFANCTAALSRHLDDPMTLVLSHVFVQAWGRKA